MSNIGIGSDQEAQAIVEGLILLELWAASKHPRWINLPYGPDDVTRLKFRVLAAFPHLKPMYVGNREQRRRTAGA